MYQNQVTHTQQYAETPLTKVVLWTLVQHVRKDSHSLSFPESGKIGILFRNGSKICKISFVATGFEPQSTDYELAPLLTQPQTLGENRFKINEPYSAVYFRPFKNNSGGYY